MRNTKTIKEVSDAINEGGSPEMLISEFIDDFNASNFQERLKLIEPQPAEMGKKHLKVFLAALVDHLCHCDGIRRPEWTKTLALPEPYFFGGDALKAVLLQESPVAFRRRNLFVSSNAVTRV